MMVSDEILEFAKRVAGVLVRRPRIERRGVEQQVHGFGEEVSPRHESR